MPVRLVAPAGMSVFAAKLTISNSSATRGSTLPRVRAFPMVCFPISEAIGNFVISKEEARFSIAIIPAV